jgi:hypothetical protein
MATLLALHNLGMVPIARIGTGKRINFYFFLGVHRSRKANDKIIRAT